MPIPAVQGKSAFHQTAREYVYTALRDWIVDGTLAPGEKIYDTEIAKYFSVSRTPVREAIQQLGNQKLVEIHPGKESRVSPIDYAGIQQTYMLMAELHGLAVRFAYEHITKETLVQLEEINVEIGAACYQQEMFRLSSLDEAFHAVFLELADNDFLRSFSTTLYTHTMRTERMYYNIADYSKDPYQEHQQIIKALKNHDLEQAVNGMKYNWIHTADVLRTYFAENGMN